MLATSGIDYDVKLWAPSNEESTFDEKFAEDVSKFNLFIINFSYNSILIDDFFFVAEETKRCYVRGNQRHHHCASCVYDQDVGLLESNKK